MTPKQRQRIKKAKKEWKNSMRKAHSDFTPKKWASTAYRINHPQPY